MRLDKKKITSGGMLNASPVTVAHQTMRYEKMAIQRILPTNVIAKNFLSEGFLVSGSVNHIGKIKGSTQM